MLLVTADILNCILFLLCTSEYKKICEKTHYKKNIPIQLGIVSCFGVGPTTAFLDECKLVNFSCYYQQSYHSILLFLTAKVLSCVRYISSLGGTNSPPPHTHIRHHHRRGTNNTVLKKGQ